MAFSHLLANYRWAPFWKPLLRTSISANSTKAEKAHYTAGLATALAYMGTLTGKPKMVSDGYEMNGGVIRALHWALQEKSKDDMARWALTIMVLCMYQYTIEANPNLPHYVGVIQVIEFCGPEHFQHEPMLTIFRQIRAQHSCSSFFHKEASFFEQVAWKTIPWRHSHKTLHDRLIDMFDVELRAWDHLSRLHKWRKDWEVVNPKAATEVWLHLPQDADGITIPWVKDLLTRAINVKSANQATDLLIYNSTLVYVMQVLHVLRTGNRRPQPFPPEIDFEKTEGSPLYMPEEIKHHWQPMVEVLRIMRLAPTMIFASDSDTMLAITLWDYIVVGGGLAGSVVSNRLLGLNTTLNILVIEAGPNANDRQDIVWPNGTGGADLRWSVPTVPQVNLNNRTLDIFLGTGLGGGTLINAGNWVQGDKADYDEWGATVGDDRWSYAGQLPFMRQSEAFQHPDRNPEQHGYIGNVFAQTVTSTNRPFPLPECVLQSWNEIGVPTLLGLDGNAGNPLGVGDFSENKHNGRREIVSVIYPLDGIIVLANTLVEKVLVSSDGAIHASGVQLANGTQILSRRVILSAGALRTPQILMLSGIGPRDDLERHGIEVKAIRNPAEGWIPGSGNPLFDREQYGWSNPQDFMVSTCVDAQGLAAAIEADEGVAPDPSTHRLLQQYRTLLEHVFQYFSYGGGASGSTVSFMSILLLPTSRGTITLASTNASDFPVVDPNYFGTSVDGYVHREAQRLQYRFAGSNVTVLGREILGGEVVSEGQDALTEGITDSAPNNRLRASIRSAFHPSGTASMGKVVDNNLKVKGFDNLFVVDTSVFPVPIAAHLQVATYALAEQAATIISQT
ncbi:hypothetical protein CGLO_16796 [Colletotrichum gloeosporioides Cg-14]|uniref:Glucose-methanol-choline oxidoreductase N-terminal domain-containing protein n=1 Tax=Colletotrichum gloeosporioides (strain Cg-14) TaxID=1237896 RepID=T0JMT8_COLGC|nr:hypothetical protein CGLO_16796 [Colletotrichum gloeosporioides Cg-14]